MYGKPKKRQQKKVMPLHPDVDFIRIVLLFIIGAFLGDITETIFCRDHDGGMDEPEQCGVGTIQYCMGTGNRIGDGIAL